jgi:hypothetical protein
MMRRMLSRKRRLHPMTVVDVMRTDSRILVTGTGTRNNVKTIVYNASVERRKWYVSGPAGPVAGQVE